MAFPVRNCYAMLPKPRSEGCANRKRHVKIWTFRNGLFLNTKADPKMKQQLSWWIATFIRPVIPCRLHVQFCHAISNVCVCMGYIFLHACTGTVYRFAGDCGQTPVIPKGDHWWGMAVWERNEGWLWMVYVLISKGFVTTPNSYKIRCAFLNLLGSWVHPYDHSEVCNVYLLFQGRRSTVQRLCAWRDLRPT